MGVTGLWEILRPAGQVRSLTELAVDAFERNANGRRGYRVGIDVSIWFVHAESGKQGENPALRTLFFRLCRLAEAPFLPLFVFDGPYRPSEKRGASINPKHLHGLQSGLKRMASAFGYEWHEAPGEAEAELAYLNEVGKIDAVWSDDVDTLIFGAQVVIRNPSNTLSGNKSHPNLNADGRDDGQHSVIYRAENIESHPEVSLGRNGLIFIALMSGGDYDQKGLVRCGPKISRALIQCGFADSLVNITQMKTPATIALHLTQWCQDIANELRSNSRGFLGRKYTLLASEMEQLTDFPPLDVIDRYLSPLTSGKRGKFIDDSKWWSTAFSIAEIASFCEQYFEWGVKDTITKRFRTLVWPGACVWVLRRATLEQDTKTDHKAGTTSEIIADLSSALVPTSAIQPGPVTNEIVDLTGLMVAIHSTRRHASTDHILEYRTEINPSQFVAFVDSGLLGTRKPSRLCLTDTYSDLEGDCGGKKISKKQAPRPDDPLRVWLPASMVKTAHPKLIKKWEADNDTNTSNVPRKGKSRAKRSTESDKIWAKSPSSASGPVSDREDIGILAETSERADNEQGESASGEIFTDGNDNGNNPHSSNISKVANIRALHSSPALARVLRVTRHQQELRKLYPKAAKFYDQTFADGSTLESPGELPGDMHNNGLTRARRLARKRDREPNSTDEDELQALYKVSRTASAPHRASSTAFAIEYIEISSSSDEGIAPGPSQLPRSARPPNSVQQPNARDPTGARPRPIFSKVSKSTRTLGRSPKDCEVIDLT